VTTYTGAPFLQAGLYSALTGSAAIQALVGNPARVYDNVPQGAQYPMIVIGEMSETDSPTFGQDGHEVRCEIQSWSTDGEETTATTGAAGYKVAETIADAVKGVIFDTGITVSGHDTIAITMEDQHGERIAVTDTLNARCIKQTFLLLLEDNNS
jgi:hypothetical protein